MPAARFQVGDRVRARADAPYIRVGMVGTVRAVIFPSNMVYLVKFDVLSGVEIAADVILEPEDREPGPPAE